ncbi:MAG: hypothetical protein MK486_10165, partial [Gemmatimonadetes bacterium]|nr:hypothetical protein [Gemmatimonadota bacterium]
MKDHPDRNRDGQLHEVAGDRAFGQVLQGLLRRFGGMVGGVVFQSFCGQASAVVAEIGGPVLGFRVETLRV